MTKETEQAQVIAEKLKEQYHTDCGNNALNQTPFAWFAKYLNKVAHSQAQKIADQNQLLENCAISFKEASEKIADLHAHAQKQYTEDEIKDKCKYALAASTLENRDQFYLGFRDAFISLGALKVEP